MSCLVCSEKRSSPKTKPLFSFNAFFTNHSYHILLSLSLIRSRMTGGGFSFPFCLHATVYKSFAKQNLKTCFSPQHPGEANVYTLGDLGSHRIVSTKLPMTGTGRDALIATGSSTTRLLGTFQKVEHVFLVGVGGAVPHYTDFDRHVRLGDVVISAPPSEGQR